MKLDMRYGHHPEDVKHYDTETLRRHFLVEKIFVTGELTLVYTHVDRVVFGGEPPPTREAVDALHHRAHEACFIASSVLTEVRCEPVHD